MLLSYCVTLTDDGFGTVYALCPDLPEAMTYGASRDEVTAKVRGAVEGAIALYRNEGRPIPRPAMKTGDFAISVSVPEAEVAPPPSRRPAAEKDSRLSGWWILPSILEH